VSGKGHGGLFVSHHGQRKAKRVGEGETGKRAARNVAEKIQARLALGGSMTEQPTTPTLADYAVSWLRSYVAMECKPRTQELYESMLRVHLLPVFGQPLDQIRRDAIREFLATKAQAGLKRGTLYNLLATLRGLLNHAEEDGLISKNPAVRLGRRLTRLRSEDDGRRVDIFTEQELSHLLATAERHETEHVDLITTAAWHWASRRRVVWSTVARH
jgi:integrase